MLKWQNGSTTSREVVTFLNSKNAELPTATGGKVKITELWKENVKEAKPKTTTKVGGRDTEVYSEILVQFCLAYRLIYGQKHDKVGSGDDFDPKVFAAVKKRILTSGKFSDERSDKKNLRQFSRQISDKTDTWLDSSSASAEALVSKLRIPSDAKIFNDKIFGTGGSGDPYAVFERKHWTST